MSARAPAWFEQKWIPGVTHRLQSQGFLLKPTVEYATEVVGSIANWRIAGAGVASQVPEGIGNVTVMNADRTLVTATMTGWEANEYIKKFDLEQMSEKEQQVAMKSGAMALGRRFDQIILSTLDARTTNINTVGNGSAAISILDIFQAQTNIANIGMGSYEYYCALPAVFMTQLELFREFSSSDWVGEDYPLLRQMGARKYRGITFIPMPATFFNVPAANQADGYLWVKEAVGFAYAQQLQARVDYVPEKKSWLVAQDMMACSAALLDDGVQRLRFATNIALARPTP